jgi:hypothetical protein
MVIPIQALLIYTAMRAFGQGWNIEVERWVGGSGAAPSGAGA